MSKCILCDKPLPKHTKKDLKSSDLVCDACNHSIDQKIDTAIEAKKRKELQEYEEIKERLKHLERLSNELNELIESAPDACAETEESLENFPESVRPYLHTPIKTFKMVQFLLAITKGEYMDSITKQDSEVRLENALKKAVEKEDYRKSAIIRDKIKEKKEKRNKK